MKHANAAGGHRAGTLCDSAARATGRGLETEHETALTRSVYRGAAEDAEHKLKNVICPLSLRPLRHGGEPVVGPCQPATTPYHSARQGEARHVYPFRPVLAEARHAGIGPDAVDRGLP